MHGTFSHWAQGRPTANVLGEDAMSYAQQELYAGQPVVCGGKSTFVQYVRAGLVWLAGFAQPVPLSKVQPC